MRGSSALESLAAGIETVYQDLVAAAEHERGGERRADCPNSPLMKAGSPVRSTGARWRARRRARSKRWACPAMPVFRRRLIEQLPLATRQLVAIARAIASEAKFVIMDEPTTSLTQKEVDNLIAVLANLRAQGVTVLFVSHKLDECYAIGGEVIVLARRPEDGARTDRAIHQSADQRIDDGTSSVE